MLLCFAAVGFIMPTSTAVAIQNQDKTAGTAAGLMGLITFAFGALAIFTITILVGTSSAGLALFISSCVRDFGFLAIVIESGPTKGVGLMANLIFIAGSGHGGWWFDPIVEKLRQLGHRVFAPSLTGLDHEVDHTGPVNLDTHIDDVLSLIDENGLEDVAIIAHSYGGMVSTGVADRTSARVTHLIYLDAILPQPGERLWDLIDDDFRNGFLSTAYDGLNSYPSPEFKAFRPRVMPHPLGTILQPLNFSQAVFETPKKVYVYAEKYFHNPAMLSPFKVVFEELSRRPDWITKCLPFGHDLLEEAPDEVLEIVLNALET